jgi:hypothetical protein
MLQLNKSQTTNTVAFYPDTPITGSAVSVRFTGSQDYDRHNTEFDGSVISNLNNTPWVIAQIAGTTLPSASGIYIECIRIITCCFSRMGKCNIQMGSILTNMG